MDLIYGKIQPGTAYLINHDSNAKIQFITNHNASSTIGMEIKTNGNIEFPTDFDI